MTFILWGPKLGAQMPRREVLSDMHSNLPRGKIPCIRLTERQQLALALRESERLAAATEYHDDVSDSCSSDAESEDAFSSVHGKLHQVPSATESRARISRYPRGSGDHSPNKSDLIGSHDSCTLRVGSGPTFLSPDVCNSLDGYSRHQHCPGATPDPLRTESDCQADRDSDVEDDASRLHSLNQRLWSSNSEDSTTAAGLALTDHDANSCHLRPSSAGTSTVHSNHTYKSMPTSHQATPPHKRGQEALSYPVSAIAADKRQRFSNDVVNHSQTSEAADVHPNVTERRRRRQKKLGGCRAAVRQSPASGALKTLASLPSQQTQPSLRRTSTRQIHRVVLQESDPFAEAAVSAVQHGPAAIPPVRVRLRKPTNPGVTPPCRSSPAASQHQDTSQDPDGSCFDNARTPSPSPHPAGHTEALRASSPSFLQMCPNLNGEQQPECGPSSPSTPRVQAPFVCVSQQPASAVMTSAPCRTSMKLQDASVAATRLPFGSPAVVRQSASFFSSPSPSPSPAPIPLQEGLLPSPAAPPSEATAVVTISPMSAAATGRNEASKGSPCPAVTMDTQVSGQRADIQTPPTAAAATAAALSPVTPALSLQRKRLRLRLPSVEAESWSTLSRVMSIGPAPPFLEKRSPNDPPVVVLKARRSKAATPRSTSRSTPRNAADSQATVNIWLSPCTPRSNSSSCSWHPRSVASSLGGSKSSSIAGSASNVSSHVADDLLHERSGCREAAGLAAGCLKLRQLKRSADVPVCTPMGGAHQAAGSVSVADDLISRVSKSVKGLQRRQQAEEALMHHHTSRDDSTSSVSPCSAASKQQQQHASVAGGCAALQRHQSAFKFPPLPGLVRGVSISNQQDSLKARQKLEYSTLHALRNWLAGK